MPTHDLKAIFKGTTFDECYFTLDGQKSIRLTRVKDNSYQGIWGNVDLRDVHEEESVRFSLVARGVPGDRCSLELLVDEKLLKTYNRNNGLYYGDSGWASKVDIVYLPKK